MEVRVLIKPNSNANAFSMTYLDNGSSFGVHLSPNQIKAGDLAAGGPGTPVAFNTTNAFHVYRVVKLPSSHTVRVYVDGATTPIVTGAGNTTYIVGSSEFYLYPRVLIGAFGLLRLPTFYERLHAPTMGTTLGTGLILIASMVLFSTLASRPVLHEIAIGIFMTVTTPVTYMLLLRAAVRRDRSANGVPEATAGK